MPTSELLCLAGCGLLLFDRPLRSDVEVDVDRGLGGKLLTLEFFGGAGKAPILVVFRSVFPGVGRADTGEGEPVGGVIVDVELNVGIAGVECVLTGRGVGRPEVVTARVSGLPIGVAMDDAEEGGRLSASSGIAGSGFLVLATGKAGRGPDGGAEGGAEGGGLRSSGRCGIALLMVAVAVIDMTLV